MESLSTASAGKLTALAIKDYILSMLFVRYLSDVAQEKIENYIKQYEGDMRRVERAMTGSGLLWMRTPRSTTFIRTE